MLPVNPRFYTGASSSSISAVLSEKNISILEETKALTPPEKINLISLLLGYKWVTDIAIDQNTKAQENARKVLDRIGLTYDDNSYTFDENEKHTWIQVAASQRILEYVLDNADSLTVIEAGILYGFPASHVLGYTDLIPKEWKDEKTIAEFYLAGVYSKKYSSRETEYFESIWQEIAKQSSKILEEAKNFYEEYLKNNSL